MGLTKEKEEKTKKEKKKEEEEEKKKEKEEEERSVAYWLRHYATNRQVAGSIPDGVIGIFK
jgi:uncharacterized membrane protein YdbT with pleckstrin-like domain